MGPKSELREFLMTGRARITPEQASPADPALTMFVYTAEPGSKSEEALNLLGSWTATLDEEEDHADHEEQHRDRRRSD